MTTLLLFLCWAKAGGSDSLVVVGYSLLGRIASNKDEKRRTNNEQL
jgi:hypothetical protein